MALDLTKVAAQVGDMLGRLKNRRQQGQERLLLALSTLHQSGSDFESLKKKIEDSKTTWLVAGLTENPGNVYPQPQSPAEFTVLASDGSHIDVDRHHAAHCYVINTGGVTLHYGNKPYAELESQPKLYDLDADLVVPPPDGKGRDQIIEGGLLSIKRAVEESRHLADIASAQPPGSSSLALVDGSLIMWGLEAFPDFVTDVFLIKGFLEHLNTLKNLNKDRKQAAASYISLPRSADVVNALRLSLCPLETINTDRSCQDCATKECEGVDGIVDRDLFSDLLKPGERSALFASQSSVIKKYYGDNRIYFFYLKLEQEIARVEIPEWVTKSPDLLNLTHALIADQCKRGHGYPVALAEAHEQAVITGADREDFWQLVVALQTEERLTALTSAKSFSKRTRWV